MESFFDVIQIRHDRCPPDCMNCIETCEKERGSHAVSGLRKVQAPERRPENLCAISICHQCSQPSCADYCPTGAIIRDDIQGVVRIHEERCIGCALCTIGCSLGGIDCSTETRKAFKCDLCGGSPKCINACPHGALTFRRSRSVRTQLHDDVMAPATSLCQGCGAELGIRFSQRVLGPSIITIGGPGCGAMTIAGTEFGTFRKGASFLGSMTNLPSIATGITRYYAKQKKDVTCVIFAGDGITADVGFQPLSGAAERGENILYICYDNEAYMNTGIQRSSTTPFGAWTTTTPIGTESIGKSEAAKNMPLIMAFHGIPYAATASLAFLEDFARKLQKAQAIKTGLRYIHLLAPCPTGWRCGTDLLIELARLAVETNYFPLWEAEKGAFRITYRVASPRPVEEFTRLQGRFKHLKDDELAQLQEMVNEKTRQLEALTQVMSVKEKNAP